MLAVLMWCLAAVWPRGTVRAAQTATAAPSVVDAPGLYDEKCSLCHGANRAGNPPAFPTLIGVTAKYTDAEIAGQIKHGKGRMPAFATLSDAQVNALVALLKTPVPGESKAAGDASGGSDANGGSAAKPPQ